MEGILHDEEQIYTLATTPKFTNLTVTSMLQNISEIESMGVNAKLFLLHQLIDKPQNNKSYLKVVKYVRKSIIKDNNSSSHQKLFSRIIIPNKLTYKFNRTILSLTYRNYLR